MDIYIYVYIYTCNIQKAIFWKILPNCENIRRFAEKLTIQAKIADWAIFPSMSQQIYLSILRPFQRSNAKLKGKHRYECQPTYCKCSRPDSPQCK